MKFIAEKALYFLTMCLVISGAVEAKKTKRKIHWEDQIVPNAYVVSNTKPSGSGSLQRAIEKARINSDIPTKISFNIPPSDPGYNPETGTYVIELEKTLRISSNTLIDGYTQKGSSANTQILEYPNDAVLTIEIQPKTLTTEDFNPPFGDTIVFTEKSSNSRLKGVIVHGSPYIVPATEKKGAFYPAAIRILGNEHVIEGCFVGVDSTGERSDSTITAIVVEGNNNVIGDEKLSFTQRLPQPAKRMIIGGLGATLGNEYIPAVLFTGKGNKIANGQLGIRKSGTSGLDHIAETGLLAAINTSQRCSNSTESDLTIDTFAAAGSQHKLFNLMNFNTIQVRNVSAGTTLDRTAGLGGGIGLSAENSFTSIPDQTENNEPRGILTITDSIFSGLVTGIQLGNKQEGLLSGPHLQAVTVQNSYIGTNGLGTAAIPNTYGATSQGVSTLTVTGNSISGNIIVGWQHETSVSGSENIPLFSSNRIGIATPPSMHSLPNGRGISILGNGQVTLQNNDIENDDRGVISTKNAQMIMKENAIKQSTKTNTPNKGLQWAKKIIQYLKRG
jgi:hypothetical protein